MLKCPKCGSEMVLRTARRGKSKGSYFYGCSKYPQCKTTLDIQEDLETKDNNEGLETFENRFLNNPETIPVFLQAREKFKNYQVRFYQTLSLPSEALEEINLNSKYKQDLQKFSQWRVDFPISSSPLDRDELKHIILIAHKILTRGYLTMTSPDIEDQLFNCFKPDNKKLYGFNFQDYLGFINLEEKSSAWFDGFKTEKNFYNNTLPVFLGKYYKNFVLPQVHLSSLIGSNSAEENQRVDFLINIDNNPIVVELEGKEHEEHEERDSNRKKILTECGYKVISIENNEIENDNGPNLKSLEELLKSEKKDIVYTKKPKANFFNGINIIHHIQLTIIEAILSGFINDNKFSTIYFDVDSINLTLKDCRFIIGVALEDFKNLMQNLSELYQVDLNLSNLKIDVLKGNENKDGIVITYNENLICNLPKFIIQYISFPKTIAHFDRPNKYSVIKSISENNLLFFLRYIFRYDSFWEGQYEAISRALSGKDAIVLLPTGSGKTIVFQLASFLISGVTIVIDPIKSLINDQIDNLELIGIDRTVGITSHITDWNIRKKLVDMFGQGEYIFCYVAPERFQMQQYREALKTLTVSTPISLIVIDEAHCVSEWGHDFRTSYLNIGRISREFCKFEGNTPPLLALTGTASNSVLKDVQRELDILDFDAIVTPKTFDRKELNFLIYDSESDNKFNILKGYLQRKLPGYFSISSSSFFQPNQVRTNSGLVFCPHVGGEYGVVQISHRVNYELGIINKYYCGKKPKTYKVHDSVWENHKMKIAKEYKYNVYPLLVATKSFGMGIDKSNVRYTIHYGIPNSIESFYQESGRAGRDKKKSLCCIILSNDVEDRSEKLLNPDKTIDEIEEIMQKERSWDNDDDITRAMYFHLNSFRGVKRELQDVEKIIEDINDFSKYGEHVLFYKDKANKPSTEKGLHRLLVLGVIEDYTINYSSKEFTIILTGNTEDEIIDHYLRYVNGYNKGRVATERKKISRFKDKNNNEFIYESCRILIEFVYDTIEKGRRRALREMLTLSESALSSKDPNSTIRNGILRYLETTYSEEIEEIYAEVNSFEKLRKLVDGYVETDSQELIGGIRSPRDAMEIRGQVSRYLESYPDHPGLLFLRAVSELYCTDMVIKIIYQNLIAAINFSNTRYDMEDRILNDCIGWILILIYDRNPHLYREIVSQLLYEFDGVNLARYLINMEELVDNMLYEPGIYLFGSISKEVLKIIK